MDSLIKKAFAAILILSLTLALLSGCASKAPGGTDHAEPSARTTNARACVPKLSLQNTATANG